MIEIGQRYHARYFKPGQVVRLDNGDYALLLTKEPMRYSIVIGRDLSTLSNGLFSSISFNDYVTLVSK